MKTSRLEHIFDTHPKTYPLQTIALEMRKGTGTLHNLHKNATARTLAQATTYARKLRKTHGQAPYDEIKKSMPQFMPSVASHSRSTGASEPFNGLVCLEYDTENIDTPYAFVLACQNPHVVMAWRSLVRKTKTSYPRRNGIFGHRPSPQPVYLPTRLGDSLPTF